MPPKKLCIYSLIKEDKRMCKHLFRSQVIRKNPVVITDIKAVQREHYDNLFKKVKQGQRVRINGQRVS